MSHWLGPYLCDVGSPGMSRAQRIWSLWQRGASERGREKREGRMGEKVPDIGNFCLSSSSFPSWPNVAFAFIHLPLPSPSDQLSPFPSLASTYLLRHPRRQPSPIRRIHQEYHSRVPRTRVGFFSGTWTLQRGP